MTTVEFGGHLIETPQPCGDPGMVSSAVTDIPFVSNPPQKQVGASTGRKLLTVNSPSAFVTLFGDGSEADPTQATTLYARVRSPGFQIRITFANPVNPDSPIVVGPMPLGGTYLHEPDAASGYWATKFEIQGAGPVEFYASGTT